MTHCDPSDEPRIERCKKCRGREYDYHIIQGFCLYCWYHRGEKIAAEKRSKKAVERKDKKKKYVDDLIVENAKLKLQLAQQEGDHENN